ncbi:cilia- and flagella-associated protein 57-like isoform X2 [Tachysurus ichikawai]
MDAKMSVGGTQIKPCHSFGVCKDVKNNLLFQDEETVIFPSGKYCVSYNFHQQHPKFIHGTKGSNVMQALALSPDRRYLAVSERGKWGSIVIIDLEDQKRPKKQVLTGKDCGVQDFICMAFSADAEYLIGQAGGPTWNLICWQWKKNKLIATVKTTIQGNISQISFNPENEKQVCVTGKGIFKIFTFKTETLRLEKVYTVEKLNILCHTWMPGDSIIAGTEEGQLLILKSKCLQRLGKASERQKEKVESPTPMAAVTAIVPYSKGFACSAGRGLVSLYEETQDNDDYKKIETLRIPVHPYSSQPLQEIATMCTSPSEETLAVSTEQGQLYHISFTSEDIIENKKTKFKYLSHCLHSGSITGMSVCAMKPLIATCSKDRTVHIWNYSTKTLVQFKEFDEEPLCVSIHPSSLSILVGFSTEVCLMNVLNDNMRTVCKYPTGSCTECVFNHDGNKFAAVNQNVITIYNIRTQKKMDLNGHHKKVQSVKWSENDTRLVSCGMDGNVFVWDVLVGNVVIRNEKTCSYADMAFSPTNGSIHCVDRSHIWEISNEGVLCEMASDGAANTAIAVTRSGRTVFVGTAAGTVKVLDYSLEKENMKWKEHQAHSGPITKMAVTPGDQYLLTASKDGSLFIWSIMDEDGQTIETVSEVDYTEEVLCTKKFVDEKEDTINELKFHIEWMEKEQEITMNMMDVNCNEEINGIKQSYQKQIQALKEELQILRSLKQLEKDSYEKVKAEMKENTAKAMKDREMILDMEPRLEFEKNKEFEQKLQLVQENLENELQKTKENNRSAMKESKQAYDTELQELQAAFEQEVKNAKDKQQRILEDATYEILELYSEYEKDIQEEKETAQMFEQELQLMDKNLTTYWTIKSLSEEQLSKISALREEMQKLKDQLWDVSQSFRCLSKVKEEQSQIISDQESSIEELKKNIEDLERSLEESKKELFSVIVQSEKHDKERKGSSQLSVIEQLQEKVEENNYMFSKIVAEISVAMKKNQEIIFDLKRKIEVKDKDLSIEREKVISVNNMVERMKNDIYNCSRFIQEPKKLKETFIELHKRHIHEPDVNISVVDEDLLKHNKHIEYFYKILESQRSAHTKEVQTEMNKNYRLTAENRSLSEQLIDQRLKQLHLLNSCKEQNIQCNCMASSKKKSKCVYTADQKSLLKLRQRQITW